MRTLCLVLAVTLSDVSGADDARPVASHELQECGVSCLYDLLTVLGRKTSVEQIRGELRAVNPAVRYSQMSIKDLVGLLRRHDVNARAFFMDTTKTAEIPTPSILYFPPVDGQPAGDPVGHYVVLHKVVGDTATVFDPEPGFGVAKVPMESLRSVWKGHIVCVADESLFFSILGSRTKAVAFFVMTALAMVQLVLLRTTLQRRRSGGGCGPART